MQTLFYISFNPPNFGDLSAGFSLEMEYDNLHNITKKIQDHTKNTVAVEENTYVNNYAYTQNHPHQIQTIQNGQETETFTYDSNGNLTDHEGEDSWLYFWDEANRLRSAVKNEGKMTHYIYDAGGERTLKAQGEYQGLFENGIPTDGGVQLNSYTTYPSAYMTIAPNSVYTKHYFAGTQRVAGKPDKYHPDGHWDYKGPGKNSNWENIYPNFIPSKDSNIFDRLELKYEKWKYERELEKYNEDLKNYKQNLIFS